jgi:dTDP-4-amino-4,6-dideoxygalactose transaminase
MNQIPYFDFKRASGKLKRSWSIAIDQVIDDGKFIGGEHLARFESEWSRYLAIDYAIGVGNGLDAITIALRALGIGSGNKVVVPAHTFIATYLAVESVGAEVVPIDCTSNGLLDLDLLENLQTQVDAVIPVHMHGSAVDMPRLISWARQHDVYIIEDCAQAHGQKIGGKFTGTWGDFGAFSFYPSKNLGALGDAGAIVTSNKRYADSARSISNYGATPERKYEYQGRGINSRLDPLQAAVLGVNLKYLDDWNTRRREIASEYIAKLNQKGFSLLSEIPSDSVWHHFIVLTEERDRLKEFLAMRGIGTEIHYPESAETIFQKLRQTSDPISPKATELARKTLSLPIHPWLTDDEVNRIISNVNEWGQNHDQSSEDI